MEEEGRREHPEETASFRAPQWEVMQVTAPSSPPCPGMGTLAGNTTGRAHKAPLRFGPSMAAGGRASPPQGPHCQSSMAGFDPALRTPFCREGRCRRHTTRAAQCSIPRFHDLTGRLSPAPASSLGLSPLSRLRELALSNVGGSRWGSEPPLMFRRPRGVFRLLQTTKSI